MSEIIDWACSYLASHGYHLKTKFPENIQDTPYSYVVRFATSEGYIYLKQTPSMIAIEAAIIQMLRDQFHISVPEIIAQHAELNCFLMKDAGGKLREVFKKQFDLDLACRAVDQFSLMQVAVADHVNQFIELGVPDWRLEKMPLLFEKFLSYKEILVKDGLSENELTNLKKLVPNISCLCEKLSNIPIKPSIVQPDCNDNNTLVKDGSHEITFIDLGEIAISHPFFSMINFLFQMKKHHLLNEEDQAYKNILETYLNNFTCFASKKLLLEAFEMAGKLWFVYGALAYERLMRACGVENILAFQPGKLRQELIQLIRLF